jgi:hypothetical protein
MRALKRCDYSTKSHRALEECRQQPKASKGHHRNETTLN